MTSPIPIGTLGFLGDLYQDLSEKARKKYALLQTPNFVEEFILDRTLEPALDEFGLNPTVSGKALTAGSDDQETGHFKMIDPACGSGHFLLGSFPRILKRWKEQEPGTNIRELVQRTLNSIHGVDINPFAVAIARFRLLLVSLQACEINKLADAPAFVMNLACGDSLYHGVVKQQTMDFTDEAHYFRTEDAESLRRILQEGTFHAVVANPPYIVPRDRAANEAYRRLFSRTCHRQYSLAVPFMEQVFNLSVHGKHENCGFTGQITANSFMKREFGKKLIELFFPSVDLSCVIDTQLAHIPGHGTPTVIIFGRNRSPIASSVRLVGAISREDVEPAEPADGLVWQSIVQMVDHVGSQNEYVSVSDAQRNLFHLHPWSIGGGGASELKEQLDQATSKRLGDLIETISAGICITREDEAYLIEQEKTLDRYRVQRAFQIGAVQGEHVRDWACREYGSAIFPYNSNLLPIDGKQGQTVRNRLWSWRELLWRRRELSGDHRELGRTWWEWNRFLTHRFREPRGIAYSEVSTHNHFVFDKGGKVFTRTAPVVKLRSDATDSDFDSFVATLNSSIACFWLKQSCHCKGGGGIGGGIAAEAWERFYAFNGTKVKDFPILPSPSKTALAAAATTANQRICPSDGKDVHKQIANEHKRRCLERSMQIRLQEDLDWECYRLYGLLEDDLTYPTEASLSIQLGERAFEIVLARKMAAGDVTTTWFSRHGSTPITEIPDHWPDDYQQLVQKRIDVIESNKNIALIEQPEYKRRWNTEPWDKQVAKALKSWLLDRLESYFDFDGRMKNSSGGFQPPNSDDGGKMPPLPHTAPPLADIALYSLSKLAAVAAEDPQFMEVAEVYRDDPAFDVLALIEDLVAEEHVPLLPVLRYKPAGIRKRAEWEQVWQWQRLEDELRDGKPFTDARVRSLATDCGITEEQQSGIEAWQQKTKPEQRADTTNPVARELDAILSITVPPKYKSSDFISTGGAKFWKLRGKLDVPKERWVSLPHCEGSDGTMMIAWAGYDHLQLARAISAHYVDIKNNLGGSEDPRLVPLLAGIMELLPWLHQWHNEIDPEFDMRMNEYYDDTFVESNAAELGLSRVEIKNWQPPKKKPKRRAKKKAAKKKKETTT